MIDPRIVSSVKRPPKRKVYGEPNENLVPEFRIEKHWRFPDIDRFLTKIVFPIIQKVPWSFYYAYKIKNELQFVRLLQAIEVVPVAYAKVDKPWDSGSEARGV